jgi:GNAT superfamily N-acetyltransferase
MTGPDRVDAYALMKRFRLDDGALGDALTLFLEREDYGFVWLAYRDDSPVACCSVGYHIATDAGGVIALIRDIYVLPDARRAGIGAAMLAELIVKLDDQGIARIDAPLAADPGLQAFLRKQGFTATDERTFSLGR